MRPPDYGTVSRAVGVHGLRARGCLDVDDADDLPAFGDGRPVRTVVMLGNAGDEFWPVFSVSPEAQDGEPDPLNRWSRRVVGALAEAFGGLALLPFSGPPYLPFVRWAKRAEAVRESPLGLLIHPEYGLWHAWRGALALADRLAPPPRDTRPHPCDTCRDKPCLGACPVGAFAPAGYDVGACVAHIASDAGAPCMDGGCRARGACPVGVRYRYPDAQMKFHMSAFYHARRAALAGVDPSR